MCSLYSLRHSPAETKARFGYEETPDFPPRPVIAPGQPIAIIRQDQAVRHFSLVRWGFVAGWMKTVAGRPLVNIRAETALEKPTFKAAMQRRRCLIPADGFYEWHGEVPGQKQKYAIAYADQRLFAFAGLWEHWLGPDGSELESAAILTIAAVGPLAHPHVRMPVILTPDQYAPWLDCIGTEAKTAHWLLAPPEAKDLRHTLLPATRKTMHPPPPAQGRLF